MTPPTSKKTAKKKTSTKATAKKSARSMVLRSAEELRGDLANIGDVAVADLRRLEALRPLVQATPDGPSAERAACVAALFRTADPAADDKTFRAFMSRVNRKMKGKLELRALKAADGVARVGFAAIDDAEKRVAEYSHSASDLPPNVIDTPVTPSDPEARLPLSYTVLYTKDDKQEAERLIDDLRPVLRASSKFAHDLWDQRQILTGQEPQQVIDEALARSDYVLALLSPRFLVDRTLDRARAAARGRTCIPVALGLLAKGHDLGEFTHRDIFRRANTVWSQCSTKPQREAFANELFQEIERVVEAGRKNVNVLHAKMHKQAQHEAALEEHIRCPVDNDAVRTDLRDVEVDPQRAVAPQSGLQMLVDWALRKDAPPYACVLGEFGIGKTTLLKRFTLELLERREKGADAPLPIFLDLRTPIESIRAGGGRLPELEELLGELTRRTWKSSGPPPEPAQLLRLVREEGAVMIIDGLDEKMVHLDEAQGMDLIRMLWGILPPRLHRSRTSGRSTGRIVLSCRSHLFPTLQRQNYSFTGDLRDDVRADEYLALVVLPFNEEKIREYLQKHLGDERAEGARRLIASVHNLSDLAPRPLFLNLIQRQIGRIEELAARGETVRGVSLYDHLVASASDRDRGKHRILAEDKPRLMEALAAAMWRDGAREWPWDQVFHWLRAQIRCDEALRIEYESKSMEQLAEDFRTATMVLRPDQGDGFRFAHTSLQEYFLARWLHRALVEGRPEDWALPMPSDETLDFLGQLQIVRSGDRWRATLRGLLELHRPQASRIAFRYWLMAIDRGYPQPDPARVCLPGEDLEGWTIAGTVDAPLVLHDANFRGVKLRNADLRHIDLTRADLRGCEGLLASFSSVNISGTLLDGADLTGSVWRDCRIQDVQADEVTWWDSEWVRCAPPSGVSSANAASAPPPLTAALERREGHSGTVMACSFSPDGRAIVSASYDNTLKVWDAASGRALFALSGHSGGVNACAWSSDGRTIASASSDNTLRLWEAASRQAVRTLSGHSGAVNSCAFSPDGRTIVSASDDETIKVWDAASGRTLFTLSGHSGPVKACAFSPDGCTIVSGSTDKTLGLWDAATGVLNSFLERHSSSVNACVFSPDGRTVVSGSSDSTLKVWDIASRRAIFTISGHSGSVRACAYSPDGRAIVSASSDTTLRVWDADSGRALRSLSGHSGLVRSCVFSPDGRVIVSASDDRTLKVWDSVTGHERLSLAGHSDLVMACAWSPDGRSIVSASSDTTLEVWDATTGRAIRSLSGHSGWVTACAWSPDGRTIVSASHDHTLKVWDAASGRVLVTLTGHPHRVNACGYSPDGRAIISAYSENTLKVWDVASGRVRLTLSGHSGWVRACAWSPDSHRIVSASEDKTLKVWDAATGRAFTSFSCHSAPVRACAWSPDGRAILSASDDTTLKVWDPATGYVFRSFYGHVRPVNACAWSPDGRSVVSASSDHTLKVWDAASGEARLSLSGHSAPVWACAWSPDGHTIGSASHDGTTRLWDATSGKLLRTLWHSHDAAAALDHVNNRVLWATPNAWRYLCYRGFDPERGAFRVYPVEAFSPLPTT